uniref:Chloroplastic group IIB intron splicing facilitator CRS2, chloroplastic n=1 Tax=Anthurium amnicola TaxID=1678845 RepID=A0A1D1YM79_9ARAE
MLGVASFTGAIKCPPHQLHHHRQHLGRSPIAWRRRRLLPVRRGDRRVLASLPDADGAKVEYTPWLIVGLGNPGNKYHGTRHNVGFEMVDGIAKAEGITLNTIQSKALIGIGSIGEVPILLAKPQAYMNFSGESVGPLAAYYQVPLRHILLIYDEMSLPNGILRLQPKGGHGHHNGLKNVMDHLDGRREFPRLSIGIGNQPGTMDMKAFLLQKFSQKEREQIDAALEQGVDAVRTLVSKGFINSITRFNLGQKYKYHKV